MKFFINKFKTIIFLIIVFNITSNELNSFELKKMPLKKPYSTLSCKIDSLYYALQYYVVNLENIEWFINNLPVKSDRYLKINIDGTYSIINPLKYIPGSIHGQQARLTYKKELKIFYSNKFVDIYYDKNNYLDVKKNYDNYRRIVSFGIDNRLIISAFSEYFEKNNININFFYLKNTTLENVIDLFTNELKSNRVIICNGITDGYKNPRIFEFKILNSKETYKWKEASHSYVIIGYNFKKKLFIVADNYGDIKNPYKPKFRNITFEQVYNEITLIDKNKLDNSFSIGKK